MSRLGRVLRADVYHADEDDRDHMVRDDLRDSAADVFEPFVDSDDDTPRGESETDSPEAMTDGGESPEPGEPFRIDFRAYSGGNAAVQPYYTVPAEVFIHYFEDTDEHVILVTQGWLDDHEDDDAARSSEWARYHIDGTTVDPDDVFAHDRIDRPTATDGGRPSAIADVGIGHAVSVDYDAEPSNGPVSKELSGVVVHARRFEDGFDDYRFVTVDGDDGDVWRITRDGGVHRQGDDPAVWYAAGHMADVSVEYPSSDADTNVRCYDCGEPTPTDDVVTEREGGSADTRPFQVPKCPDCAGGEGE